MLKKKTEEYIQCILFLHKVQNQPNQGTLFRHSTTQKSKESAWILTVGWWFPEAGVIWEGLGGMCPGVLYGYY